MDGCDDMVVLLQFKV